MAKICLELENVRLGKTTKDNLFATGDPKTVSPARRLTYQSEKPVLQRVELKHLVLFAAIF